jgi:hypothetical protein
MKVPRRLAEASSDDLERAVLRSAKRDVPPSGNRERFLATLGLGASVATAAAPAAGTAVGAVAKASGFTVIAKWVGVGAVVGLVSGAVAVQMADRGEPAVQKMHSVGQSGQAVGAVTPAQVPPPAPASTKAPTPVAQPELEARSSSTPVRMSPMPSARLPVDQEIAVLDRARKTLRAGEPERALGDLEEYTQRFPDGVLGPEAQVLRIEALAHRDPGRASALARAFLQKNPRSPLAKRVGALLNRLESADRSDGTGAPPSARQND